MEVLENIKKNISASSANAILTFDQFEDLLRQKCESIRLDLSKVKRFTKKPRSELNLAFQEGISVSSTPDWKALRDGIEYQDKFIRDAVNQHSAWCFKSTLQYWHDDLMKTSVFAFLEESWTPEDLQDLELICRNYSGSSAAATFFFFNKFASDQRLEPILQFIEQKQGPQEYRFQHSTAAQLKVISPFLDIKRIEGNLEFGLAKKTCRLTSIKYIEHYHYGKYMNNHLYLPYREYVSGWHRFHSHRKYKISESLNSDRGLSMLKRFCDAIDGVPSVKALDDPRYTASNVQRVHDAWVNLPYAKYYSDLHGDLRAALIKAKVVPNSALKSKFGVCCVAKDGHFCRSMSEHLVCNWLHDHGIEHTMEPKYSKHEEFNPSGRLRADWLIDGVLVEFFGLPDIKEYAKKIMRKRKLAEILGIELVEIFEKDLEHLSERLGRFLPRLL